MSKPLALLYFTRDKDAIAKDIAARIRNEGNLVNMVFATGFRDAHQAIKCDAVIIQQSCGRAEMIASAYQENFPETEIHLYNDEGEFDDKVTPPPADTGTEEKARDPEPAGEEISNDAAAEESNDDGGSPTVTE